MSVKKEALHSGNLTKKLERAVRLGRTPWDVGFARPASSGGGDTEPWASDCYLPCGLYITALNVSALVEDLSITQLPVESG